MTTPLDNCSVLPGEVSTYLEELSQTHSSFTVKEYELDLRLFFTFTNKKPDEVTDNDVRSFITYLKDDRNDSVTAINRKLSTLHGFFRSLVRHGTISQDPSRGFRFEKEPVKQAEFLTWEECNRLLGAAYASVCRNERNGWRDYCILKLMLNLGLRVSEVSNINLDDIKDGWLTVHGKGKRNRALFLNKHCTTYLKRYSNVRYMYLHEENEKAFFLSQKGGRMSADAIQDMVRKYMKLAGIDSSKAHPHAIRHAVATNMMEEGVDLQSIQAVLGHQGTAPESETLKRARIKRASELYWM